MRGRRDKVTKKARKIRLEEGKGREERMGKERNRKFRGRKERGTKKVRRSRLEKRKGDEKAK